MKVNQLSIYLPNRTGTLAQMTSHLARFDINIKAISLAESTDSGVVRIITNDEERAGAALCEAGYGFVITEVITVEIHDRPGGLAELCKKLSDAGIGINYLYATVTPGGGVAMAVVSTDDNDRAEQTVGM